MALIKKFEKYSMERNSIHDGINARYTIFERDGRSFIQIDSFGRKSREIPGKKSQTIQLDKNSGLQLIRILKKTFHVS